MKLEIEENAFWLILWMTIILVAGLLFGYAIHRSFNENISYIEHGYSQKSLPGFSQTVWTKE